VCGSSERQFLLTNFLLPRLECDALSASGVRKSHCNDSLKEWKKISADTFKAMDGD